jgi:3-phenylpropionate/trans-cinnamate dioxygenase ferredoxin subunit
MGLLSKKKPAEWVFAAKSQDFTYTKLVVHNGKEYCLYKLEDGIYCSQNSCSHEYSPLCDGEIMDGEVYCLKHGSRFDIRSGKVINLPATQDIQVFPVKTEGDDVFIFV